MKTYDLMIIGPATRDINIDYTGAEDRSAGGAVIFCTPAARSVGGNVFAAVKIAPEDRDILDVLRMDGEDVALLPSGKTTLMRNEYFTADRERRNSSCPAQSDPILPEEIPDVPCKLYHLAGLLYGDFPNALIERLREKALVSADAQGFLRHNEGGKMCFHDWADKMTYLPCMDFFKTDAAEAEILTGLTDRAEAARTLYGWGAKEVLITHNTEVLVYDGKEIYTCPIKARSLGGRTGRGDTTFACYVNERLTQDIPAALRTATALVSLKMETPGPYMGTRADVEAYIKEFY